MKLFNKTFTEPDNKILKFQQKNKKTIKQNRRYITTSFNTHFYQKPSTGRQSLKQNQYVKTQNPLNRSLIAFSCTSQRKNQKDMFRQQFKNKIFRSCSLQQDSQQTSNKIQNDLYESQYQQIKKQQKVDLNKLILKYITLNSQKINIKKDEYKKDEQILIKSFNPNTINQGRNLQNTSQQYQLENKDDYQEQINNMTSQFINEWKKSQLKKKQTYQYFKRKLKHFYIKKKQDFLLERQKQFLQFNQDSLKDQKQQLLKNKNKLYISNQKSKSNRQVKSQLTKKNYFWSRTKNKSFYCQYIPPSNMQQQSKNQNKAKNCNFLKYLKSKKTSYNLLTKSIKNQISQTKCQMILSLQKQGTKQHKMLKRFIDKNIK